MRTISSRYLSLMLMLMLAASCSDSGDQLTGSDQAPTATGSPVIGVTLATRAPPTAPLMSFTPEPAPSATPVPTPTPRTHIVESGDTILGMAIQYGVETEAIMALNSGIRPEALQIGQAILLPPPPTPAAADALTNEPAASVAVRSATTYQAAGNGIWVLGDVVNEDTRTVENVQVALRLPLVDGRIAEARVWVVPGVVAAGGSAPFGALFRQVGPAAGPVQTAVVGGRPVSELGSRYLDLAVEELVTHIDGGQIGLEGSIANQGELSPTRLVLVATAYDALDRVSGYRLLDLEGALDPGQSRSFELSMTLPGGQAERILTAVLGLVELAP